ncbi:MAG: hypothetical protein NTX13_01755 [Acidobacteria bacterium]|nr:hypothetical protein [Acidobacteriota bacterium]
MNQRISFESQHSIQGIESVLKAIEANPGARLLVQTKLPKRHFGVDAALIQALITWKRRGGSHLEVYRATDAAKSIEGLIRTDHGLVALILAETLLLSGTLTELTIPRESLYSRLNQAVNENVKRGPKLFFLLKDHRRSVENLTPLYYPAEDADQGMLLQHEFTQLMRQQLYNALIAVKTIPKDHPIVTTLLPPICTVLFELFENTHRWARTDANLNPYALGLRAIRVEVHRNDINNLRTQSTLSGPIHHYLANKHFDHISEQVRLLEVSVLDSGPGLAARALKRNLTPQDDLNTEIDAVESRFHLHRTSSGATHRGKGLPAILQILSEHQGFLRVRTGRLNIYRNFIDHPYAGSPDYTHAGAPLFSDWSGNAAKTTHARAEGVLITFIFPLSHLLF